MLSIHYEILWDQVLLENIDNFQKSRVVTKPTITTFNEKKQAEKVSNITHVVIATVVQEREETKRKKGKEGRTGFHRD